MSAEELSKYRQLRLNVTVTMIKINNTCCFWNQIISGIFLFQVLYLNQFVEENS